MVGGGAAAGGAIMDAAAGMRGMAPVSGRTRSASAIRTGNSGLDTVMGSNIG
jgi:hypothetical protein